MGREPNADVFLANGSVSRRHALITVTGEEATIADLDSKHGTFIEKQVIRAEVGLRDGSFVRFGKVEMLYRRWTGADATDSFIEV